MNKAIKKVLLYQSTLGTRGAIAFLFARLTRTQPVFKKRLPGVKHPVSIRLGTTDLSVLLQTLVERHYAVELGIKPKVIIDAGANIGLSAVFFANKFPDALIIAIEPEESNFKMLQINSAPYSNIKPFRAALWREDKMISLVDPGYGSHGFQTTSGDGSDAHSRGLVPGITINSIIAQNNLKTIDLLKLDIEGSEKDIFDHSAGWINKVKVVMTELHDHLKPGCSTSFMEATKDFGAPVSIGEIIMRSRDIPAEQT